MSNVKPTSEDDRRQARGELCLLLMRFRGVRTQYDVGHAARKIDPTSTGLLAHEWYSRIERGDRSTLSYREIRLIAQVLGASLEELLVAAERAGY